ncbi:MAG: GNAT family N-acetyltransferase [Deltaproteobacteria bacterium]|nr:GNAT family N-acetyltransferase [Deltaproteobacteria bacterium]
MDYRERWASKIVSAEEAVRKIRPSRRIFIGSGSGEPAHLVRGLVAHGAHLENNEVVHLLTLGPAPYVDPGMDGRFRHTAFFIGKNVRAAVQEGRADFMPVFLSEIPALMKSRRVHIDVALIQVTEPDRHGMVSLGTSVDIVRAAVDSADLVIAQVNRRVPRTLGNSFVDVSRIDWLVPHDEDLPELPVEAPDAASLEVGRLVASLVPDGATLQMGIGSIPDAVLRQLGGRHDLGVHTEMFSDGAMRLAEAGVITGRKKSFLPGKMVTSFVMGSRALYDWVHDNPRVEFRGSDSTNDPFTIARHDDMIAINSALAVDLTGQVAADTLMGRFFSGIGGQVDFIRGAARSRRGKPIIALPATAKDGALSRIQPAFEAGAGVVTSRGDVHYVVTEYGIADLWGKSIRQRAMALIAIAHPDFRSELLAGAKARKYVFADQAAPSAVYPWFETRQANLRDGSPVTLRPARVTDEDALARLEAEAVGAPGLPSRPPAPAHRRAHLAALDYDARLVLLGTRTDESGEELLAKCDYEVDPATQLASIRLVVRPDVHGRGLGTLLVRRLLEIARGRGLRGLAADVSQDNRLLLDILHRAGLPGTTTPLPGGSSVRVEILFEGTGLPIGSPGTDAGAGVAS